MCGNKKRKEFCPRFIPSDFIYSASLDRYFPCINLDSPKVVNCKSQNLIYLITRSKCLLQYVGQTCSVISVRFCMHRACMSGKNMHLLVNDCVIIFRLDRAKGQTILFK